jgi:hypothetical protein
MLMTVGRSEMATVVTQPADRARTRIREIGPIGTVSRLAVGLAALALPIVFEGLGWWDVLGWVGLALLATAASRPVLLTVGRYAPEARGRRLGASSATACVLAALLLAASVAIGVGTPAQGDVVFWGFLGLSMLVAAARGDAGCEVVALPNALLRRRDVVGCIIFTPIDAAEARRNPSAARNNRSLHEPAPR